MSAATIARLKITLDNVTPVVLRRVEVPFDIRLDRLHLTIQAAMGWTNSHLYEIRAGGVGWSTPYPDADWAGDFIDARKARLEDIGTKSLQYLYDFGDGWEHTIKIERLIDPEPGILYPRLIEAKGHCPPEDVGGPWGYGEFLEAIADPSHERHRDERPAGGSSLRARLACRLDRAKHREPSLSSPHWRRQSVEPRERMPAKSMLPAAHPASHDHAVIEY